MFRKAPTRLFFSRIPPAFFDFYFNIFRGCLSARHDRVQARRDQINETSCRGADGTTFEAALVGIVIVGLRFQPDFWCARLLRTKPLVFVGTISFSLYFSFYLWQQPFSNVNLPITHAFPLGILEAFAAATFGCFVIEAPFLRLKDRLATRLQRSPVSKQERMGAQSEGVRPKPAK